MLGSILDVRRYLEEDDEADLWDHDSLMSDTTKTRYHDMKQTAKDIWEWLTDNVQLELDGSSDNLDVNNRLQTLSIRYLVQQCKALISHKLKSEKAEVYGEAKCVTAKAIKAAIEMDFAEEVDFMELWPKSMPRQTLEAWAGTYQKEHPHYNWPAAPEGGSYRIVLVS